MFKRLSTELALIYAALFGAVLLLMFSVMVFLVGLVSEQISSLRFENRR